MTQRILILEDDPLIALDLADQLTRADFTVVGPATSTKGARTLLTTVGCDAAVLDVNLGSETSEAFAHDLVVLGVPFLSVSGYSREQLPAIFHARPMFSKPAHMPTLIRALHKLLAN